MSIRSLVNEFSPTHCGFNRFVSKSKTKYLFLLPLTIVIKKNLHFFYHFNRIFCVKNPSLSFFRYLVKAFIVLTKQSARTVSLSLNRFWKFIEQWFFDCLFTFPITCSQRFDIHSKQISNDIRLRDEYQNDASNVPVLICFPLLCVYHQNDSMPDYNRPWNRNIVTRDTTDTSLGLFNIWNVSVELFPN